MVVKCFSMLQSEAKRTDGSVHTLLGNHEFMNLEGQHHYVSPQELQRLIKDMEPEALDYQQQKEQGLRLFKQYLQPVDILSEAMEKSKQFCKAA